MLVCCGLVTLDVVQVVDALPGPDEKVVARSLAATFGGPAANAAATAVALGVPPTLVTAVGHGPLAAVVRSELESSGVALGTVRPGSPGRPSPRSRRCWSRVRPASARS
nr:PfkB family carbohydrate kinase [Cellulosimicrobium sp. MM]